MSNALTPVTSAAATTDRFAALLAASACPKTYSTTEVARFFEKTDQWVYWVLREGVTRAGGSLIEPERVGKGNRRRGRAGGLSGKGHGPPLQSAVIAAAQLLRYRRSCPIDTSESVTNSPTPNLLIRQPHWNIFGSCWRR